LHSSDLLKPMLGRRMRLKLRFVDKRGLAVPRTKGSLDITGWREHSLIRDLALNAETVEDLSGRCPSVMVYIGGWCRTLVQIDVIAGDHKPA
jgi:hypothetical protein